MVLLGHAAQRRPGRYDVGMVLQRGAKRAGALIAICLFAAEAVVAAPAPARPKECAAPLGAIAAVRKKLDAGREVLSADEADCAFLQFTLQGMSEQCAQRMERATPKAKRAWNEMVENWQALDRLRL